jgi:hypothetical protein
VHFHKRTYLAYLILGKRGAAPPWHHREWLAATSHLPPLLEAARGPAAVRSTQTTDDGSTLLFGRLGWNPRSHAKWTHGSPETARQSARWTFVSTEVWAPHWNVCAREDAAPDVFLSMAPAIVPELGFDVGVLLALHDQLPGEILQAGAHHVIREFARVVRPVLLAQARLPWGRALPGGGFTDALQDYLLSSLYHPGMGKIPELRRLGGRWRALHVGKEG